MITTNYCRSDWKKFIGGMIIKFVMPVLFLVFCVVYLYMPYLESWTSYIGFAKETKEINNFIFYADENNLRTGMISDIDGIRMFFVLMWFGGAMFPVWMIFRFYRFIPLERIAKKTGCKPVMKLAVFKNGKHVKRLRDLL